jgi:hypothetical protein
MPPEGGDGPPTFANARLKRKPSKSALFPSITFLRSSNCSRRWMAIPNSAPFCLHAPSNHCRLWAKASNAMQRRRSSCCDGPCSRSGVGCLASRLVLLRKHQARDLRGLWSKLVTATWRWRRQSGGSRCSLGLVELDPGFRMAPRAAARKASKGRSDAMATRWSGGRREAGQSLQRALTGRRLQKWRQDGSNRRRSATKRRKRRRDGRQRSGGPLSKTSFFFLSYFLEEEKTKMSSHRIRREQEKK